MHHYNPKIHHRRNIRLQGYDYSQAGAYFITICIHNMKCMFGEIAVGAGFTPARNGEAIFKGTPAQNSAAIFQNNPAEMILNDFGTIAYQHWEKLPERFSNVELDVFQIMPNHMHGIIVLKSVGAGFTPARNSEAISDDKIIVYNDGARVNDDRIIVYNDGARVNDDRIIVNNDGARVNDDRIIVYNDGARVNDDRIIVNNDGARVNPAPTIGDIIGAYKSLVSNDCLEQFKINHLNAGKEHHQIPMMGKLLQRNYWEHIIRNEPSYKRISNYIINNPDNWKGDKFYNE